MHGGGNLLQVCQDVDTYASPSDGCVFSCMCVRVLGAHWNGWVNTRIVIEKVRELDNGDVVVTQKYDNYLTNADGTKIPGTDNKWYE